MTRLDKFCLYTPLKTFGISLLIILLLYAIISIVYPPSEAQRMGRHFYLTYAQGVATIAVVYSLTCTLGMYAISLNLFRTIRNNAILSFLTFFLIPTALFAYIFVEALSIGKLVLLAAVPFFNPLIYYYQKFRKQVRSGEIMEGFYVPVEEEEYGSYNEENM